MFINYLDQIPQIPAELIPEVKNIVDLKLYTNTNLTDAYQFSLKCVNQDLYNWIVINVLPHTSIKQDKNLRIFYQLIANGKTKFPIHKDINRTLAYNYILDPGGSDVITNVYDDNKNLLESVCLMPFRWHSIKVDKFHDVINLPDNAVRIAVTLHSFVF